MTSAWFLGAQHSVPQDETIARSTLDPIRSDPQHAEMTNDPEWNDVDSDSSGQLFGLSPRVVGDSTHESVKYAPALIETATAEHNQIIDRQVATSGTAAAREASGVQGHGSMFYEVGIEPLNPAQRYGNDFFVRNPLGANEGSSEYMTPVATDHWAQAVAQSAATDASRRAQMSTVYSQFMAG